MTDTLALDTRARSVEALMLARFWSRPSAAEVESWRKLARNQPDMVRHLLGASGAAWIAGGDQAMLAAEYDSRIRGERASPASPYESLWRDDVPPTQRHGFWPPTVASLKRIYAKLPTPPPSDLVVDEITVEMNALASALAEASRRPLARQLVNDHLVRWLPEFLRAVTVTTSQPFYRWLADATSGWLDAVRSELADDAASPNGAT